MLILGAPVEEKGNLKYLKLCNRAKILTRHLLSSSSLGLLRKNSSRLMLRVERFEPVKARQQDNSKNSKI